MLGWSVVFFIIALVAGMLGFTGIADTASEIAKIIFIIFLIMFIASIVMQSVGRAFSMLTWVLIFFNTFSGCWCSWIYRNCNCECWNCKSGLSYFSCFTHCFICNAFVSTEKLNFKLYAPVTCLREHN